MFSNKFHFTVVVALLLYSCSQKKVKPDNIYNYRNYISYTTSGIISTSDVFEINVTQPIDAWEKGKEISSDLIEVTPNVKGKLIAKNNTTLQFIPLESLQSNTAYSITIKLDKIFKEIDKEQHTYTFQCKTITPSFSIATNSLQSYDTNWQYVTGVIKSADYISLDAAKKIITATQKGDEIAVVWKETSKKSKYFDFKLDSLQRFENDTEVLVNLIEDIQKNKEIEQQVERWDIMAKIVPTTFLLISASLTVWGWITLDTAFYIGLSIFAVTSVIWWFWTIFTIRYLIRILNRAATNLSEVRYEFRTVAKDVERMKDETRQ